MTGVTKLSRIRLIAAQPEQLAEFYESAFGFTRTKSAATDAASLAKLLGKPDATVRLLALRLGEQEIELVGFRYRRPQLSTRGRLEPAVSALRDRRCRHGSGL